ncbi:MAG: hypothetical protein AB8V03_01670 [Francisella endosymbiont of Hyalomma asiaticum]
MPDDIIQNFYQPSASGFKVKIKTKLGSINKIKKL